MYKKTSLNNYPSHIVAKIKSLRPDIYAAIEKRNPELILVDNSLLPKWFYRENLKKFFPNRKSISAFDPVTLYRGVDSEALDSKFFGEKSLVWSSRNIEDAIPYSINGGYKLKRVYIIRIVVPRFMVYERSGWPTLRFEDVHDLQPFIDKVAQLEIDQSTKAFLESHNGDTNKIITFLHSKHPKLFDDSSIYWKDY